MPVRKRAAASAKKSAQPRRPAPKASRARVPAEIDDSASLELAVGSVIAARLREFRQEGGLTVAQLAAMSGLSKGMLSKLENSQTSPSLSTLTRLSLALDVPLTSFFRGLDEERDVLFVKAGRGFDIVHKGSRSGHRYQLLGSMRGAHQRLEPVLVTLLERSEVFPLYQHPGTELLYMLAGRMEYGVGNATYVLEPGDALQLDGEVTHGPRNLLALPVQFLSIKAYGGMPTS